EVMKADSFLVSLFFDEKKTQMSADKVNSITKNMVKGVIGSVAVFASYSFLKSMVNDFAEGAAEAGKFASSVHSDVEAVDALCQSLARNGGSVDGFKNSLTGMDNYIQKSVKGNKDAQNSFKQLGVSLRDAQGNLRETDKIMLDVADKFSSMSADKQDMFAAKMGIDSKTLGLMKQGKVSLEEMIASQKVNGTVTKQQVAMSKVYKQLLWDMDNAYKRVKNRIAESMMPYVLKFLSTVKDVTNYLKEHKGLVVGFFTAIGTALLVYLAPALARTTLQVYKFTASLLTNPVFLIIAAVIALGAAIALLVDDFMVWKKGGESSFGAVWEVVDGFFDTLIGWFGIVKSAISNWVSSNQESINKIKASFTSIGKLLQTIGSIVSVFVGIWFDAFMIDISIVFRVIGIVLLFAGIVVGCFADIALGISGFVADGITKLSNFANWILTGFVKPFKLVGAIIKDIFRGLIDWVSGKFEWVMSKIKAITDIKDKVVGVFKSANSPNVARPSASTSIANSTSNNTKKTEVNTTTTVQKVEVNVQNGDPQSISKGIGSALERSLTPNFNGGLLA
ncbi:MAG: hypothetical protein EKK64_02530, partial [Neisseriaceae bacterium]